MITNAFADSSPNLADRTANSADHAIKSTQYTVNHALDGLAGNVQTLREQASPMLDRASAHAGALAQRGMDGVRHTAQQLRESARHTSDNARGYVRDDPLKSVLMAAAAGAMLVALVNLLGYWRNRL